MDIIFTFICDYANGTGKINAMGLGFDTIYASQVPYTHHSFFLVAKLRASVVEIGEKEIKIALIDADGKSIIPDLVSKIRLQRYEGLNESKANIVLQFGNVQFPDYGNYEFKIVVEGEVKGSISLRVAEPPKSA